MYLSLALSYFYTRHHELVVFLDKRGLHSVTKFGGNSLAFLVVVGGVLDSNPPFFLGGGG